MLAFYLSSVFKGIMGNDIDERTYRSPRIFSYGIKERRKPIDIDLERIKRQPVYDNCLWKDTDISYKLKR